MMRVTLNPEMLRWACERVRDRRCKTSRFSSLTAPVLASARAELEMPIDEQAYTELIEKNIKKQEASIEDFMKQIKSFSTAQQDGAPEAQNPAPR